MLGRDLIEGRRIGPAVQILTKVREPDFGEHDVPPARRHQEPDVEALFGSGQERLGEAVWIEIRVLRVCERHVPTLRTDRGAAEAFRETFRRRAEINSRSGGDFSTPRFDSGQRPRGGRWRLVVLSALPVLTKDLAAPDVAITAVSEGFLALDPGLQVAGLHERALAGLVLHVRARADLVQVELAEAVAGAEGHRLSRDALPPL